METFTLGHRSSSQNTLSHMYANTVYTNTVTGCGDVLNQERMTEARGDKGLTAHDAERVRVRVCV